MKVQAMCLYNSMCNIQLDFPNGDVTYILSSLFALNTKIQ